jgi:RIO kinase 2
MRLNATDLRYLSADEFQVLKACETGSLSHEVVPSALIASTSGLHHTGLNKIMSELSRRALIARERNIKYDGWRLTHGGYDWLAVRAMREKNALFGVGTRVGVGKESDIYMAYQPPPFPEEPAPVAVLKVHRLGRISFRKIKEKRDYLGERTSSPNWMYLSRLAAKKEWLFMQTLHKHGFPVPLPIYQSRHAILMSRIDGYPLRQIVDLPAEHVASLFAGLMALIVRLARAGLIHCDFNEFNIMVRQAGRDGEDDGADEDDKEEDIWARAKGLTHGEIRDTAEGQDEYQLQPGERIEKGNGFERIYRVDESLQDEQQESQEGTESDDDDEIENDEEDGLSEEQREFDAIGTNEALRVQLKDGSSIEPILIDFPQMISVEHPNAEFYFDRDVEGVRSFFKRRFRFVSEEVPVFRDIVPIQRQHERSARASKRVKRAKEAEAEGRDLEEIPEDEKPLGLELDVLTQASGLGRTDKEVSALEQVSLARIYQHAVLDLNIPPDPSSTWLQ